MNEYELAEIWEKEMKSDYGITADLKIRGVEIDFETADSIVSASMFDQYYNLKKDIETQKTKKNLLEYQKEDLKDNKYLLDACIVVLKHYTVYEKWPEELKKE